MLISVEHRKKFYNHEALSIVWSEYSSVCVFLLMGDAIPLARLCVSVGLSEPSLLAGAISSKLSL